MYDPVCYNRVLNVENIIFIIPDVFFFLIKIPEMPDYNIRDYFQNVNPRDETDISVNGTPNTRFENAYFFFFFYLNCYPRHRPSSLRYCAYFYG